MKFFIIFLMMFSTQLLGNNMNGEYKCDKLYKSKDFYYEALTHLNKNDYNDIHDKSQYKTIIIPPAPDWAKCVNITVVTVVESTNFFILTNTIVAGANFGIVEDDLFYQTGDVIKVLARPGFFNFSNENLSTFAVPLYTEEDGSKSIKYQSLNRRRVDYPSSVFTGVVVIVNGYWK